MEPVLNEAQEQEKGQSWPAVIEFLVSQSRETEIKQNEWVLEKKELEEENNELKGKLYAQESLNEDLMRRVKMLEYSLKRERIKFVALLNKNNGEEKERMLEELRKEENIPEEVENILKEKKPDLELPKKRAKKAKEFLNKILK